MKDPTLKVIRWGDAMGKHTGGLLLVSLTLAV